MFGPDPLPLELAERLAKTQSGRQALDLIEALFACLTDARAEVKRLRDVVEPDEETPLREVLEVLRKHGLVSELAVCGSSNTCRKCGKLRYEGPVCPVEAACLMCGR